MGVWKRRGVRVFVGIGVVVLAGLGVGHHFLTDIAPPDLSEFEVERPTVAEEENAYTHFRRALASMHWPSGREDDNPDGIDLDAIRDIYLRDDTGRRTLFHVRHDPEEIAGMTRRFLERNAEVFVHVRNGVETPIYLPPLKTGIDDNPFSVLDWNEISALLLIATEYNRRIGNHEAAAEMLLLHLAFTSHILQNPTGSIDWIAGGGRLSWGLSFVWILLYHPGVSTETLERLAGFLEQIDPVSSTLADATQMEFLNIARLIFDKDKDEVSSYLLNNFSDDVVPESRWATFLLETYPSYFFHPNRTKRAMARDLRTFLSQIPLPWKSLNIDRFARSTSVESAREHGYRPNLIGRINVQDFRFFLERLLQYRCEFDVELAGTRLLVALHRYRRANDALPGGLDELVPAYLPAVPSDPFDGAPFRYCREQGIVYSVGWNGVDNGGDPGIFGDWSLRSRWDALDIVFWVEPPTDPDWNPDDG